MSEEDFGHLKRSLEEGKVVLMLCDTVFGLVSKAPETESTLQKIKGRPDDKPFLQLFGSLEQLRQSSWQLPPEQLRAYWPGPLTCVLGPKPGAVFSPYCQQDSQAVRIPRHAILQKLCHAVQSPLYSSSANRSGQSVPETQEGLLREFAAEISAGLIIPYFPSGPREGEASFSEAPALLASTLVDARCLPPRVLRQGGLVLEL
ncbi:MAG: L-threonylcarbamoyladenylate synthase [Spirochaetota bacterium]